MTDLGSQYSCDEMSPGGTESVLLTNGKAVANIQRGMYQEVLLWSHGDQDDSIIRPMMT